MEFNINASSNVTLYQQIMEQLKEKIESGELSAGTPLPSVRMMSKELGISVITIRRAYTELENEGYVLTVPAKGTFVARDFAGQLKKMGRVKLEEIILYAALLARKLNIDQDEFVALAERRYGDSETDNFDNMNLMLPKMNDRRIR